MSGSREAAPTPHSFRLSSGSPSSRLGTARKGRGPHPSRRRRTTCALPRLRLCQERGLSLISPNMPSRVVPEAHRAARRPRRCHSWRIQCQAAAAAPPWRLVAGAGRSASPGLVVIWLLRFEVGGEECRDAPAGVLRRGFVKHRSRQPSHHREQDRHVAGVVVVEEAMAGAGVLLDVVVHVGRGQDAFQPLGGALCVPRISSAAVTSKVALPAVRP